MWYFMIPIAIFAVDFCIKDWIEQQNTVFSMKILGGHAKLQKSHNYGAMLNFMEKRQKLLTIFSTGLTLGIFVVYLYMISKKGMHLLKLGISFLLGGALSNVYDRLIRKYVVDYLSFCLKWKKFQRIIFNLGDIFIFLGSLLVVLWSSKDES